MTQTQAPPKKGRWQSLKEFVRPPKNPSDRVNEAGIIAKESGFIPWFNIKDVEQRRSEIITIMQELNSLEFTILQHTETKEIKITQQKQFLFNSYKLAKLFQLYFVTGSPWVRGADNETLSQATAAFIENFEDCGDIPGAFRDLHAEATYLLHLSWQAVDVTQTPPYITQFMNPPQKNRIDLTGGVGGPEDNSNSRRGKSRNSEDV